MNMKRIILFFASLTFAIGMMAQVAAETNQAPQRPRQQPFAKEHLKFKGVEIDGTPTSFAQQLLQKGCTRGDSGDGLIFLNGSVAGYSGCDIFISSTDKIVSWVGVAFPKRTEWSSFYSNYSTIKDMLTQKYGTPTKDILNWQGYMPDTDGMRWHKATNQELELQTLFDTDKGRIVLTYISLEYEAGYVTLYYYDALNQPAVQQSLMEDL